MTFLKTQLKVRKTKALEEAVLSYMARKLSSGFKSSSHVTEVPSMTRGSVSNLAAGPLCESACRHRIHRLTVKLPVCVGSGSTFEVLKAPSYSIHLSSLSPRGESLFLGASAAESNGFSSTGGLADAVTASQWENWSWGRRA